MKWCHKHNEYLPIDQFYKGQTWCKECKKKYNDKNDRQALMILCRNAIYRTKRIKGNYANVTCPYTSTKEFYYAIMNDKRLKEMYENGWKKYVESGYNPGFKPSMDRIDINGGYTLNNIQFLSRNDHMVKDHKVLKVDVFYTNDGELFVKRMTKKEAQLDYPGISDVMNGGYGDGVLIQNAAITVNPAKLMKRNKDFDKQYSLQFMIRMAQNNEDV